MSEVLKPERSRSALAVALRIMAPLVRWLVRRGVGHAELSAALKSVFYTQAVHEAVALDAKPTDSRLSLLSGLHRRDVKALRDAFEQSTDSEMQTVDLNQPAATGAEVVGRWLALGWPMRIAVRGKDESFEALVQGVSNDKYFRSVLEHLERLGAVHCEGEMVALVREAFLPEPKSEEALAFFRSQIEDHLRAAVHNIDTTDEQGRYLDQSVFVEQISSTSAQELHHMARILWADTRQRLLQLASIVYERDKNRHHPMPLQTAPGRAPKVDKADTRINPQHKNPSARFRFGVYVYTEDQGEPNAQSK